MVVIINSLISVKCLPYSKFIPINIYQRYLLSLSQSLSLPHCPRILPYGYQNIYDAPESPKHPRLIHGTLEKFSEYLGSIPTGFTSLFLVIDLALRALTDSAGDSVVQAWGGNCTESFLDIRNICRQLYLHNSMSLSAFYQTLFSALPELR